jgi:hypothetical protein
MNLREALDTDKLDKFIAERKGGTGDADVFDATLVSMAGKSKATPKASSRDGSGD